MTASLYQSASPIGRCPARVDCNAAALWTIGHGGLVWLQGEDVGGQRRRIESNVVAGAAPAELHAGEQVLDLVRPVGRQAQVGEGQVDPAGLGVVRVQVHHRQDDVGEIIRRLCPCNELVVVDRLE